MTCDSLEYANMQSTIVIQQLMLTAFIVAGFVCTKTIYDNIRKRQARVTVVVIGGGPIGLLSILIAAKTGKVRKLILFEELCKKALLNKPHQLAMDPKSVIFLRKLGVDFDNIEGCWSNDSFFTHVGIFQEYLVNVICRLDISKDLRFGHKFTRDSIKELESIEGRRMVIVCDGANGQAVRQLGLSDEFIQHSCRAYGAVAAIDRQDASNVPLPERRYHNLFFDLSAYGTDTSQVDGHQGFSLKLFGGSRHRYMTLATNKNESVLVKTLRVVLDRSVMRNIFLKCFNTYKDEGEKEIGDSVALKHMKFSSRLFEIKLSQRVETVGYFQESNTFVVAEGEAARCYNIHTGMDVNVGIKGLMSLSKLITMATTAETEHAIMNTMQQKSNHAEQVCKDFLKNGLNEYMFLRPS
ncbi:hypothetical protein SNE40_007403 [Patella caerulea]|uniref:Uncharacterized protein n=1 Tax=Patella caerulea TaxID=87958 RepID=A0AAN8K5V6_PATCE